MQAFFLSHNPNKTRLRRQYASIIFVENDSELEVATEVKHSFEKRQKCKCTTEIITRSTDQFTDAEDYHQKYILRQFKSVTELLETEDFFYGP